MNFQTEAEFVRWLRTLGQRRRAQVRMGIGDDAALVRVTPNRDLILTSDLSIEGVHFTTRLHPPGSIGHRALARSLSDVAAMGGTPRFALVSVAFPRTISRAWIEEFYRGVFDLAARYGVEVVGGDTSIVRRTVMIDVTVAGEVARGGGLLRSGARPGDRIFVSGWLGQSARGLEVLEVRLRSRKSRNDTPDAAAAVYAHLFPSPRCELGQWLQRTGIPTAMMDISDGLSTDLTRLCETSGVGAKVHAERIPRPAGVPPEHSLKLALNGGEDYELLFTVPKRRLTTLPRSHRGVPLRCIGEVCRLRDVVLVEEDGTQLALAPAGYDHFSKGLAMER